MSLLTLKENADYLSFFWQKFHFVSMNCLFSDKASGSSVDWAHEMAGIPYAYTPELRDKGVYGFIAPPSEINPSAQEVYEAIKVIGNKFV